MAKRKNPHEGSSFEDFLASLPEDEQIEMRATALKMELCLRIRKEMKKKGIGVRKLQKLMDTSPSQIQRLLDENYTGVSLKNLVKLHSVLGKELSLSVK